MMNNQYFAGHKSMNICNSEDEWEDWSIGSSYL